MTDIKGDIPEIIRLQLRKPTNWGWELSTSKPSRTVRLPTIQLYNYKGELLVEAEDNGEKERSWRSSTMPNKGSTTNVKKESQVSGQRHLKRSRSDTLGQNSSTNILRNKFESINRKEWNRQPNNKIKSFDASFDNSATKATADIGQENRECENKATKVITESSQTTENSRRSLKKSKSDTSQQKGHVSSNPSIYKRNSFQTFQEFAENFEARHTRRCKSDELLKRKLRSSEESVKRAELDGYINFITPSIPHHKSQDKLNRNKKVLATAETVLLDNNTSSMVVNDCTAKKYRTRTSSAGTLIISDESFNDAHSRRRRRNVGDVDKASIERKTGDALGIARKSGVGVDTMELGKRVQRISHPTSSMFERYAFNPHPSMAQTGGLDKLSSGTQTVNDVHHLHHNSEKHKLSTLKEDTGNSNRRENITHISKYVRHVSDPTNPISRRYAFNRNLDIAHSHSTGTLINNDGRQPSPLRNDRTNCTYKTNESSLYKKTDLTPNDTKYSGAVSRTAGFTKYIRPMSDPTSWISRKYACNSQRPTSKTNIQQELSNGWDNTTHVGVDNTGLTKNYPQTSKPTNSVPQWRSSSRYSSNPGDTSEDVLKKTDKVRTNRINPSSGLFYSRSDVFPFHEILNDKIEENLNDNCNNYTVQEPITPSTPSESRKNSGPIIEKLNWKQQRKVCWRDSDGSASSNTIENASRNATKGKKSRCCCPDSLLATGNVKKIHIPCVSSNGLRSSN